MPSSWFGQNGFTGGTQQAGNAGTAQQSVEGGSNTPTGGGSDPVSQMMQQNPGMQPWVAQAFVQNNITPTGRGGGAGGLDRARARLVRPG